MRLHYLFTMVTGLLGLAACQNDDSFLAEKQGTLEFYTSTEIDTRTSLQDGNKVVWNEGDAVAVYDFAATKKRFVAEINEGTTHFRGNITPKYGDFIAAYPYDLAAENDNARKIIMYLPEEQTAVKDGFGPDLNLSIAKGSRHVDGTPSEVRFRNICQLFKLSVPAYTANRIAKIELTANTAIAGQLTVDYTDYNPVITTNDQGSKTIALYPPNGSESFAEGTYYMVLAPVAVEGFTLTLTDINGKTYSQHSSATINVGYGVICNLGNVDLIDKPVITPQHVYDNGTLVGTQVTLTAPVSDKAWSAVIKNGNGDIVRTLAEATGTLTSDHTDDNWPYLPKGSYTVEYTYTTANGKQMNATAKFNITENPEFSISMTGNSSYSYYQAGNIEKANNTNANAVNEISIIVNGISTNIQSNNNYTSTRTNNFNGTEKGYGNGIITYDNITRNELGEYEFGASFTFDGITKNASKKIHITGIPYTANPPTNSDWSGSVNDWRWDRYNDHIGVRLHDHTISKYFNVPSNTNISVTQDVDVHTCTTGTTYTLLAGGNSIFSERFSGRAGGNDCHDCKGTYNGTLTSSNASVQCSNSYGNPWSSGAFYGTHALIRSITVNYR